MTSLTQPLLDNSEMNGNMGLEWVDPSRPDPGQREKIKLNFRFHTLWCLKAFIKPFEAPQRSVKIKV